MRPHPDHCPTHPGELLREDVIPSAGLSKTEFANLLGISCRELGAILAEKTPVTPRITVRLGKLCGNGADIWVRLQAAHDLWHANREVDVTALPTLKAVA